ncbi:DUF4275 family protein [Stenotrophomonas sp.]|uniref:DUF4275 family protein n=1 Tax=Stenotrophomonas sp. TaxID=69392 RepID=UPI0028A0EA00|nr:DUF4275 family protein [Stenotrophomonas sp.]
MEVHRKRGDIDQLHLLKDYTQKEAAEWADAWLSIYGRAGRGVNTKSYLWHVFSAGRYPCLSGPAAVARYVAQVGMQFVVLSNDRNHAVLTDQLPDAEAVWSDYYVFPPNLAWTMALTHEAGWLGPYFAQHPDHARLDEENLRQVQKAREIEAARSKGWLG